ncbi:hypothetical protein [Streptomyces sp. NPDC014746]|uniref:hypothetical protein n=1 Tax=Streptomyces sp. NPDC014746 TaxID=3364904 RepID=UPI0036F76B7F
MPNKRPRGYSSTGGRSGRTERVLGAIEATLDLCTDFLPATLSMRLAFIRG